MGLGLYVQGKLSDFSSFYRLTQRVIDRKKKSSWENMKYPYNSETEGNQVRKGFIIPYNTACYLYKTLRGPFEGYL